MSKSVKVQDLPDGAVIRHNRRARAIMGIRVDYDKERVLLHFGGTEYAGFDFDDTVSVLDKNEN